MDDRHVSQASRIARTVQVAQSQRRERDRHQRGRRYYSDDEDEEGVEKTTFDRENGDEDEANTYDVIFLKAFQEFRHQLTDSQLTELATLLMTFVHEESQDDAAAAPPAPAPAVASTTTLKPSNVKPKKNTQNASVETTKQPTTQPPAEKEQPKAAEEPTAKADTVAKAALRKSNRLRNVRKGGADKEVLPKRVS